MKTILRAFVLGLCSLVSGADKVDPVGTWKCEYAVDGKKRTETLTFKKDGDKLTGTIMIGSADEKLFDVKLKDGILTFSTYGGGGAIEYKYKLTINGDKLNGKLTAEFASLKNEYHLDGKRETRDK
jgi:hypothetical protein